MTTPVRIVEAAAILSIVLLVTLGVKRVVATNASLTLSPSAEKLPTVSGTPKLSRAFLERTAESAAAGAPFRLASSPASIRFGEVLTTEVDTPVPASPALPALGLTAIIGGPPWRAIVRGLPGASGDVVVRVGDRFPPFEVQEISSSGVALSGLDSLLHLRLSRAVP